MKKTIMSIFSILCMLFIFGLSIAVEKPKEPKDITEIKHKNSINGKVKNIDLDTKTITITKRNQDALITVNDETKIMMGKESKSLLDVKVGDKIRVTYAEVDGNRIAKKVSIRKPMLEEED